MYDWDICVKGICIENEKVTDKINNRLLENLDKEYELVSYDFTDRYSFNAYLKIKRHRNFVEIIEDSINEIISNQVRKDLLVEDMEEHIAIMPSRFKVKSVVFKEHRKGEISLNELFEISEYILVWKELAKIIFYFIQMGEGEDFAEYLKRNHPAVYGEIYSMRYHLQNTILSEFLEFL